MSCTPDGKELLFIRMNLQNNRDVLTLGLNGKGGEIPRIQLGFNDMQPLLSPSGRWLAYTSDLAGAPVEHTHKYV